MIEFISGTVVGGFISLFSMALVSANKRVECTKCDYYRNRFFYLSDKIKTIIGKFHNDEVTAANAINQIENILGL